MDRAINLADGSAHLFIERLPEEYAVWMGKIKSLEDVRAEYEVDECHYNDDLYSVVDSMNPEKVFVISGVLTNVVPFPSINLPPCRSTQTVDVRTIAQHFPALKSLTLIIKFSLLTFSTFKCLYLCGNKCVDTFE